MNVVHDADYKLDSFGRLKEKLSRLYKLGDIRIEAIASANNTVAELWDNFAVVPEKT